MAKVMLVEDDPTMISLLETLMQIEGFEVYTIMDFTTLLERVDTIKPDMLLMDVNLKNANGLELLEVMRLTDMHQPKVIMSSGLDYSVQALDKGANEFVLKPYMPDELIKKIKAQLGQ